MSHSDRKTEEAEIKHSLFGFCFCSMCRGLKRPEPGSKGENPKLPYDKKSYEEHFPLLGQGSQARVGQTKPGPAASSSTSAMAKASSQKAPEPSSTPSTSAVAKTNGQKVVKRKAPPAGQVPNEEPKAKRKPQRATLTKPAVKTSNRFSVLKDGVPSDDEEAMPPKKQAKTAAQRKQESRAKSKLAKKAEKAKNAARMATPAEKAKTAASHRGPP